MCTPWVHELNTEIALGVRNQRWGPYFQGDYCCLVCTSINIYVYLMVTNV